METRVQLLTFWVTASFVEVVRGDLTEFTRRNQSPKPSDRTGKVRVTLFALRVSVADKSLFEAMQGAYISVVRRTRCTTFERSH